MRQLASLCHRQGYSLLCCHAQLPPPKQAAVAAAAAPQANMAVLSSVPPARSDTVALQPPVLRGNASNEMRAVELGQPFDCASPLYLHWLLPAAWNLSVVGRDPAGNVAAPQTYSWRVAYTQGAQYTRFLRCGALG